MNTLFKDLRLDLTDFPGRWEICAACESYFLGRSPCEDCAGSGLIRVVDVSRCTVGQKRVLVRLRRATRATEHPRNGSPRDRGAADSFYGRDRQPHMYVGPTGRSRRVESHEMTLAEICEYHDGFDANERDANHKDWE